MEYPAPSESFGFYSSLMGDAQMARFVTVFALFLFLAGAGGVIEGIAPFDFNGDGYVTVADVQSFLGCMGGPDTPVGGICVLGDADFDSDVDLGDFAVLQAGYAEP